MGFVSGEGSFDKVPIGSCDALRVYVVGKSSQRWLREHLEDEFVQRSRELGYRSRAAFKLLEIDRRDWLLRTGSTVVDLGASPGGWSQLAASRVGPSGRVVAVDRLPMEQVSGVEFIQGDFRDQAVLDALLEALNESEVGLVMSDMAPNISGIKIVDQAGIMHLAELALDLSRQVLALGGDFLVKVFQGEGYDAFVGQLRESFGQVSIHKPRASRSRSREIYLLARKFGV